MSWILGCVAVFLLVLFIPKFRKFFGALLLVVVLSSLFYWYSNSREEDKSRTRISAEEIIFENVLLNQSYGSSYDFIGRIKNNSRKHKLKDVYINITFSDCPNIDETNCVIIAEEKTRLSLDIPPKQARNFKTNIFPRDDLNAQGKLIWNYGLDYSVAE
ncbi:MAG: hypothetical protein V4629_01450 [Pseudomonadota bacterium]